ncbi:hypothetical protein LJC22_03485 [Desulfosarcina sp. OttesenSCG-928-G10]|nr:hypothetical protein [Desulfosarcina sp. OttesenSCG-928-G10]
MDDFLHNLRSGKLKQPDRRRDYSDFNKAPQQQQQQQPQQRRSGYDRRRTDYYAKVTHDHFMMIKNAMDVLIENQKRTTEALVSRNKMTSRVATALDALVAMVGRKWGYEDLIPPPAELDGPPEASPDASMDTSVSPAPALSDLSAAAADRGTLEPSGEDLSAADMDVSMEDEEMDIEDMNEGPSEEEESSDSIVDMISNMRAAGDSWKKIADHFNAQQIPTLSGRGKWAGPSIKKLWEAGVSDTETDTDD